MNYVVCIPTYRRQALLEKLLRDILLQTIQPQLTIIVDGDPTSGSMKSMLQRIRSVSAWPISYIPSNHGNAPYQRYLAWRVAKNYDCEVLIYLDDDLRLNQSDDLERVINPFISCPHLEGVTVWVRSGDVSRFTETEALREYKPDILNKIADLFSGIPSGGLSPTGTRRIPHYSDQNDYSWVEWSSGRVMAFRTKLISDNSFSHNAFAMAHIKCGMGVDDTILSRSIALNRKILLAHKTAITHPSDDTPKAYPFQAYLLGYAVAYSRRFINDNYRSTEPPKFLDRIALIKHYVANNTIAWLRVLMEPKSFRFRYAWGYTKGTFHGLTRPPTAKRLTPHIDWLAAAKQALTGTAIIE